VEYLRSAFFWDVTQRRVVTWYRITTLRRVISQTSADLPSTSRRKPKIMYGTLFNIYEWEPNMTNEQRWEGHLICRQDTKFSILVHTQLTGFVYLA
jgi:hypothetical protein